jgi:hypothetical protein
MEVYLPPFGGIQESATAMGGGSEINRTKQKSIDLRETNFFEARISSRSQTWDETTRGD